ncbi:MAG: sporulation protein YqfD [Clostridiaceae bacterium]|jgi:similar to stage IV sporulation protein|nr:sporulation protein YqfD [Clostridiaceae bacterium]
MFLVHLWNYIRGYVIIIVTGKGIERFINICSKRQILLWDIVRADMDSASMKASIRGFRLMRPAARKSGCRVHIKKRCGLPFFLYRFKRRKGFKLGLFIFSALLILSVSIIWDIEIIGCKPEMIPQVMNVLNVDNIGRGSFKYKLNPKDIATKLVLNVDQIAWAGVEIKGVKLFITIKDSIEPPVLIKNDESFNIVAQRDGFVKSMEVYAGNALIKEGETVKKGQVLVSGKLESKNPEFGTRDVHALGRIIARTWYENSLPVSMIYTQRLKTGKIHKTVYIRFLDRRFKVSGGNLPYEMYETETVEKLITGPFGLKLPIGLTIDNSYEIVEKQVDLTLDEAIAVAVETAKEELRKLMPEDCIVIDEIVKHYDGENNTKYIQVVFECEEDIAGLEPVLQ